MAKKAAKRTSVRKPVRKAAKKSTRKAASKALPRAAKLTPAARGGGPPGSARADFKQPGKVAIDRMPEPHRSIARAVDRAIRAAVPGATSIVKWGNACYYHNDRAFAALMATKASVNLALPGTLIPDPSKLLEGTGGVMRHVKLRDVAAAKSEPVRKLIVAAAKVGLDRM